MFQFFAQGDQSLVLLGNEENKELQSEAGVVYIFPSPPLPCLPLFFPLFLQNMHANPFDYLKLWYFLHGGGDREQRHIEKSLQTCMLDNIPCQLFIFTHCLELERGIYLTGSLKVCQYYAIQYSYVPVHGNKKMSKRFDTISNNQNFTEP